MGTAPLCGLHGNILFLRFHAKWRINRQREFAGSNVQNELASSGLVSVWIGSSFRTLFLRVLASSGVQQGVQNIGNSLQVCIQEATIFLSEWINNVADEFVQIARQQPETKPLMLELTEYHLPMVWCVYVFVSFMPKSVCLF